MEGGILTLLFTLIGEVAGPACPSSASRRKKSRLSAGLSVLSLSWFRSELTSALPLLTLLIGGLALTVRILLLLSRLLATALLLARLLARGLALLAPILVLVRHPDLPG